MNTEKLNCNILYIAFMNEDIRPGYMRKIHSQTETLSVLSLKSLLLIMSDKGFKIYTYINGKEIKERIHEYKHHRISSMRNVFDDMLLFHQFCDIVLKICNQNNVRIIYIRRIVPITQKLIKLLRILKSMQIKIIYEYPTYPWKEEMAQFGKENVMRKLFYFLDVINYNSLITIPNMITYIGEYKGEDKRFFKIQNCGSPNCFPLKIKSKEGGDINLIAVAHISYHHGYDILIKSLHEYYKLNPNQKVYFHIVGDGKEKENLVKMTDDLKLNDYVFFHGYTDGKELDELYNNADIGVGSLRLAYDQKKWLRKTGNTSLKTVEYTFRGIPQIGVAGFTIDGNKVDIPPFLLVVEDNFTINDIINFYNKSNISADKIRNYAMEHFTWKQLFVRMLESLQFL